MRFAHRPMAAAFLLFWLVVGGVPQANAQQPVVPGAIRYIPPDAFGAVTTQPATMFQVEALQVLPLEVIQAAVLRDFGIDPAKVSRVVAFVQGPIAPPLPPGYGVVVEFTEPVDASTILPMLQEIPPEAGVANNRLLRAIWPRIAAVEGNRILVAPQATLTRMKAAAMAEPSSLQTRLASLSESHVAAVIETAPVRENLNELLAMAPELPPPFAAVRDLPSLIDHVQLSVILGENLETHLQVEGADEQATDKLQALVDSGLRVLQTQVNGNLQTALESDDPVDQAAARYSKRLADSFAVALAPQRQGNRLSWESEKGLHTAALGFAMATLFPAIQAARESARASTSLNNLKQIVIACHLYSDRHDGKLPPRYSVDDDGKPLLSWRVHLLPYLEQQELYAQFKLDEPWDSPHNRKLIEQMPEVYQSPNVPSDSKTVYQVVVGPGTIYEKRVPRSLNDIVSLVGASNSILAVEADADRAVFWTRPDDLPIEAGKELPSGLGHLRPNNVFLAIFCDGYGARMSIHDAELPGMLAPFLRLKND